MSAMVFATQADFITPASGTATTASTAFPVSNLLAATTPNRPYKSTSAAGTTEAVVLDFGATQVLDGLGIINCNVASVKVQGNATNAWTSPSYNSTVTISQDTLDTIYKSYVDLSATSFRSTGYRYLRVQCNSSTTTSGGSVWVVGSLVPVGTATALATNFGFPFGRVHLRAYDPGLKPGGGAEPSAFGNPYARITLVSSAMELTTQTVIDRIMANGPHRPLLFYRGGTTTSEVYICHRTNEVSIAQEGPNNLAVDGVVLEEYV